MLTALLWSIAIVFAAGQGWKTLKDLKGVSIRANIDREKRDRQFVALAIVILQALPDEKRAQYAGILMAQK
jgi:hypothetical protein